MSPDMKTTWIKVGSYSLHTVLLASDHIGFCDIQVEILLTESFWD
jgi:hypothetical protein